MPPMINLETTGSHQSPWLEVARNKNGLSFTSIITMIFAFGLKKSTCLESTTAFSTGEVAVNNLIHKCNVVNSNFNNTLNSFLAFVLAAGKENNECYTFKEMLAQPDQDKFLQAMLKETVPLFSSPLCQKEQSPSRQSSCLNINNFLIDLSTSTRHAIVLMEGCSNGAWIIGKYMPQLSIELACTFCWSCLRSFDWILVP